MNHFATAKKPVDSDPVASSPTLNCCNVKALEDSLDRAEAELESARIPQALLVDRSQALDPG